MLEFLGTGDVWSNLIWLLLLFVLIFFYPRLMITQMVWKLEKETEQLGQWNREATGYVTKSLHKRPTKKIKDSVRHFIDFFMVTPVDMDPYGVVKKADRVIKDQKSKFRWFIDQNTDKKDTEVKANIESGLGGAIAMNQIYKIVRHYLEIVKKYKNLQFAMLLQMQLPMIKDIAKAIRRGTKDMSDGSPVGDSIGPLITAGMMRKFKEVKDLNTAYTTKQIEGRKVVLVKAKGPGARVGEIGKAVNKLMKTYKPKRLITIDASGKLEGEKTGKVAEGVGVAMGGFGVERFEIEEITTKKGIPLDAIAIKMRPEEAFYAMKEDIFKSREKVEEILKNNLKRSKKGETIMVLGVGNTAGVGNYKKSVPEAEKIIKKNIRKMKMEERKRKEQQGFFSKLFSSQ